MAVIDTKLGRADLKQKAVKAAESAKGNTALGGGGTGPDYSYNKPVGEATPAQVKFSFIVPSSVANNPSLSKKLVGSVDPTKNTSGVQAGGSARIESIRKSTVSEAEKMGLNLGSTTVGVSSSTCFFYMPNEFEYLSAAGWAPIDADPSFLGLVTGQIASAKKDTWYGQMWEGLKSSIAPAAMEAGQSSLGLLDEGKSKGLGQALTRTLENPFTDVAFQSMQRRSFRFLWNYFLKSSDEVNSLLGSIQMLRFHQHPSVNPNLGNAAFLDYPSYIVPTFLYNGSPNKFLPQISISVIDTVSFNVTPNGHWASHSDGSPIQISLSLQITEVQPLMKEDIGKGM